VFPSPSALHFFHAKHPSTLFVKMKTDNKSASEKMQGTILNLLLPLKDTFGDLHSFCIQYFTLLLCSEVVKVVLVFRGDALF